VPNRKEVYEQNKEKLRSMPIANERLYKETAWKTGTSPKQVEEIINVVSSFVVSTIKEGAFETVMIPSFGKFKVKPKLVQFHSTLKPKSDEAI
jgi:nucleoid DNA-binding protein